MIARIAALVAVLPFVLSACGGAPTTAAAVADPPPDGVEVDRTVSGAEEVMGFQAPPGAEEGLTDAVHKIGTPVNYTVYMYESPEAAAAALALWEAGLVGTDFPQVFLSLPGPDKLGPGAVHLQDASDDFHKFVGQGGVFVVAAISEDEQAAKNAAIALYERTQ